MATVTDDRLSPAGAILCAAFTALMLACFLTGTLDLAVWVAWKVGGHRRKS